MIVMVVNSNYINLYLYIVIKYRIFRVYRKGAVLFMSYINICSVKSCHCFETVSKGNRLKSKKADIIFYTN